MCVLRHTARCIKVDCTLICISLTSILDYTILLHVDMLGSMHFQELSNGTKTDFLNKLWACIETDGSLNHACNNIHCPTWNWCTCVKEEYGITVASLLVCIWSHHTPRWHHSDLPICVCMSVVYKNWLHFVNVVSQWPLSYSCGHARWHHSG